MDTIINSNTNTASPLISAILLYGSNNDVDYASIHSVSTDENGLPTIMAGQAISTDKLVDAYRSIIGNADLQLLDQRTLAFNGETIIFWCETSVRYTFFDCPEPMGKVSGKAPHPALIFVWSNEGLRVYAIKGNQRPHYDTEIFKAPYMNVFHNANICMGNVLLPTPQPDKIDDCEAAFFQSKFTHANFSVQVNYPGGIYSLWNDLLESNEKTFPEQALVPETKDGKTMTLADLLRMDRS